MLRLYGYREGREGTPSDRAGRHVADERDITLPGHRYRMASLDLDGREQRLSVDPERDLLGGEGLDLGIDIGDMTELDADADGVAGKTRRRAGREGSDRAF